MLRILVARILRSWFCGFKENAALRAENAALREEIARTQIR